MSLLERVMAHFHAHPGEWIDGRTLARIGGYAGWRTRVSEARQRGMAIENQVSYGRYRVSRYRFTRKAQS